MVYKMSHSASENTRLPYIPARGSKKKQAIGSSTDWAYHFLDLQESVEERKDRV
jgi:hypothetical protein